MVKSLPEAKCVKCTNTVGSFDAGSGGVRVLKWAVNVSQGSISEQYAFQKWISAQFLNIVENTGVRRFVVQDQNAGSGALAAPQGLLVWIFTPDLALSSSVRSSERADPIRAMKIFWLATDRPGHVLESQSSSFEEVLLPSKSFASLEATLNSNMDLLPLSARRFQEWNVSFLQRFEGDLAERMTNPIDALYE